MRVPADTPWPKRALLATALGLLALVAGGASAANAAGIAPTPTGFRTTAVSTTSVSLAWNASPLASGYGVYRNGTRIASPTGTTYTAAGLTCGTTYTFGVDAVDILGGRSDQATLTATTSACPGDTTPPTTPPTLTSTGATATSISVSWGASSDNVAVTGYGLYRNGTLDGSTSASVRTYTFAGLACGTTYTLAVDAADAAGNRSGQRTLTASTTGCADTSPPTAPPSFAATGSTTTSISVSWGASTDNVGVTGYGLYRNGSQVGSTASGTRTYTYAGLSCGTTYTLGVDATDAAGNRSAQRTASASTSACSGGGGCTVSDTSGCVPRTTLTFMDSQFVCDRPLSSYGPLPLKVVADYSAGRKYGGNGAVDITSGCAGDGNAQTIDLIVDVRGDGKTYGPGVDAIKVRLEAGYDGGIQLTGHADCGPRFSDAAHSDGVQLQGGRDITFVDFTLGNYDAGMSTCQGAGGAFFYSGAGGYSPENVSIVRGKYIACNHALNATQAQSGSVTSASFRSGRTDGTDSVCTGFAASPACQDMNNVQHSAVVCQNWSGTRWE